MSLRAGLLAVLVAGTVANQPLPAVVAPVPASAPTIPSWTADLERDLQRVPDDLHTADAAPMTVTHFTRQLDLVRRDPNAVIEVRGTAVEARGDAVPAEPAGGSSDSSTSSSSTASASSSDATTSALPLPFDSAPSSIFKSTRSTNDACPNFMQKLLDDPTFKKCYPLSMMLRTSTSFFQASKQLVSIVRVLDATCAPDVTQCDTFLTQAAKNLLDSANCKKEYDANQLQVTEAFRGLRAYRVLRAVGCLHDPTTQGYCFAAAVTNITNPSDVFFYSMPLGLPLPGGVTPSCGACTARTMAVFHAATADRAHPISGTYSNAAQQVNTICGPGFVNDTATSGAGRNVAAPGLATTVATVAFATVLTLTAMAW
ncbi:hypothetical protein ISF_03645 [Cordyceps fumosorosea ARSEF 2679]|uniref:DUF7729 domain-containing protein n=1 Tax=Cordyceps fumosorosea (strain ARSEF 2679) TaxID=1081104 RepID=A0A167ZFZ0_CORFA|nr:hypothetical protein ISF_03645 [Cordyceps fumosorosea ARSEF 2679]OAA67469.1 hypothetical protein ISF_03645 [Cordyceps fumosorosea ARSEF 2679]